jgi:signal transduction histidine kinase
LPYPFIGRNAQTELGLTLGRLTVYSFTLVMDLIDHSFFRQFSPEVGESIRNLACLVTFREDAVIFREGDVPDALYLVLEGTVDIVKSLPGIPCQVIAQIDIDNYFGDYGVLDGQSRSAGAIARSPRVCLARIDRAPIMDVLNVAPGHSILEMTRHLVSNIRSTNERYMQDVVRKTKLTTLGEMLNTVIHDFRNPFTVIRMAAEVLNKTHKDDEALISLCKLIDEQIERMKIMTDEILEFSRGTATMVCKPTPLSDIFAQFQALNGDYLAQNKIELSLQAVDTVLSVDANKILRILQNLVHHSVESFASDGGCITIIACDVEGGVEIEVADNGPGIPENIRARLFEPFAPIGKEKGFGLGLAISKSFVEAHGGTLRAETKIGHGATFVIYLPLPKPS